MKTARAALSHPTDPTGARCHRQAVPRAADTAAVGPTGVVGSEGAGVSVRAPTARLGTRGLVVAALAALAGCAGWPHRAAPPAPVVVAYPASWQAPLPHGGQLSELGRWWQQFDDPLLSELVTAAEAVSPTLASALSRIEQSRAARTAAGAALVPTLDATASLLRGRAELGAPLVTAATAGLQAGWEWDLYGGNAASRDAAQARLQGAGAAWHEARVSVAAELAGNYTALRACEARLEQIRLDAVSRAETARLTGLAARSGFQAPANAALARASAAQGNSLVTQQRAACDSNVKALVALTGLPEPELRLQLAPGTARLPQPAQLQVGSVPANALAQRPDLYAAERDLAAAAADVTQAQAQQYPRVTLSGRLLAGRLSSGGGSYDGSLWTLGPLSVSLPLFDGGRRAADVDAARARHREATLAYAARLRGAVREVEDALIALQSSADRDVDVQVARAGFADSFRAITARYDGGLATLFELEDARRSALQAQSALIDLQRERVVAWISLYRALGGGWNAAEAPVAGSPAAAAPALTSPLN